MLRQFAYAFVALLVLMGMANAQCLPAEVVDPELRKSGYLLTDEGIDAGGLEFRIYRMESGNWLIVVQQLPGMWCLAVHGPALRRTERGA
jgi:hypothetical protein